MKRPDRESGNIFFMLFAAVAVVGVLGAATVKMMRGPLNTMVEVNRRTAAESQIAITSKLGMMTSALQANSGDCETSPNEDGYVEPMEWVDASGAGPDGVAGSEGGGWLPDEYGVSKKDPWGSNYGYCTWDAGPVVNDAGCGGAGQRRLAGSGTDNRGYPVIAIVSAGPDRTFQTGCVSFATADANTNSTLDSTEKMVVKASGSDDIVMQYTYAEASVTAGGLWELKPGTPNTAVTAKNVEIGGTATFTGGVTVGPTGSGDFPTVKTDIIQPLSPTQPAPEFTAGLMLSNAETAGNACLNTELGALAMDAATPTQLLACLDNSGTSEWVTIGGANFLWQEGATAGEIYYSGGNVGIGTNDPNLPLDIVGDAGLTGDLRLTNTHSVLWGDGTSSVRGSGPGSVEFLTGGATRLTVDSSGLVGIGAAPAASTRLLVQGTGTSNATTALNVTDSAGAPVLTARDNAQVGIGNAAPNDALDVTGAVDATFSFKIDGNTVLYVPDGADENILVGKDAGASVTGDNNAVIGASAAASLAGGTDNFIAGQAAAIALAGGSFNTIMGQGAGPTLVSGDRNILIGASDTTPIDVPAAGTDDYLNIGNTIFGDLANDYVGIGVASPNDALDVAGNIDATGNVNTGGSFTINSVTFGPALECTSAQKLEWDNATGWSCVTDMNDGSAGTPQDLESVLTAGNDANTLTALNLGGVAIGSAALSTGGTQDLELDVTGDIGADWYCDADGNNCFNAASVGNLDTFLELTDTPANYTGAGGYIVRVNAGATGLEFVNASSVPGGAAGNDTEIQYNNGGALGAEANLTYDPTTDFLINNSGEIVSARLSAERFDFRGGWGTGLQMPVANEMGIFTNGTEKIRIDTAGDISISGTGAMKLHAGTTAQRPGTPANGMIRYNNTANKFEVYENGTWKYIQTGAATALAFTDLSDTPAVYTGAAYKLAMVNPTETGVVFSYTDAVLLPSGTTAERPGTATNGMIRYNGTNNKFEVYQNGAWVNLITSGAGSALALDDLTDAATDYATDDNMFIGSGAGTSIQAGGARNLFIGETAGNATTTGTENLFVGFEAGKINTGSNNTFLGIRAGQANTTALDNTFVGAGSGYTNSTGTGNSFLGYSAGWSNGIGSANTFIGSNAGRWHTTGNWNNYFGNSSGNANSTGSSNLMMGFEAGKGSIGASNVSNNVFLGHQSGMNVLTGANNNVFVGYQSGNSVTTGAGNLLLGYDVDTPTATTSNFLNIGDAIFGDLSTDQIRIGGSGALSGFSDLDVAGTLAVKLSAGTTAQRPGTPANGMIRYNSTSNKFEGYENGAWKDIIAAAGALSFLDLSDTPAVYTGAAYKLAMVNAGETGMIFSDTSAVLLPSGTTAQRPGTGVNGMIRYNSTTNLFEVYQNGAWTSAIGSELWTDNTTHISRGTVRILNAGQTMTSAGLDGGVEGLIWHEDKKALRAGVATEANHRWDEAEIGLHSIGLGNEVRASGSKAVALGEYAAALGDASVAMGWAPYASGTGSVAIGPGSWATGERSVALGGDSAAATGSRSIALGRHVVAGNGTAGSGLGDGAMAIGLMDDAVTITTEPQVTGIQSLGIFMGDQDGGLVMSAANTMGLFGGKMVIDPAVPATQLTARGTLDVGAGTDAVVLTSGTTAQRPGTGVNGMIRYNADSNKFEGYQNGAWQDILTSGGGAGSLDSLSDAETDYATDFNLLIGTPADAWAIAAGGQYNLTLGQTAGDSITTGDRNVAMGYGALTTGATMTDNIAIGYNALTLNQNSGTNNVAIGSRTMDANTTGDQNVAIGTDALGDFTAGTRNTAIGHSTFSSLTSGDENVAIGGFAMGNGIGGTSANVAVGWGALQNLTTGSGNNVAIGYQAGNTTTTGFSNILIGNGATAPAAGTSNFLNIGDTIFGDLSTDQIRIGGSGALSGFSDLDVAGTLAVKLSAGTTAQRPGTPANGMIRYNATTNKFEVYENGAWVNLITSGSGATAAGNDREIQFNNAGALGASSNFKWTSGGELDLQTTSTGNVPLLNLRTTAGGGNATAIRFYNNTSTLVGDIESWDSGLDITAVTNPTNILIESATGNTVLPTLGLYRDDSDSAAASGIGAALTFNLETATNGTNREAARIAGVWDDATNNSKDGSLRFYTMGPDAASGTTSTTEYMRISSRGNVGIGDIATLSAGGAFTSNQTVLMAARSAAEPVVIGILNDNTNANAQAAISAFSNAGYLSMGIDSLASPDSGGAYLWNQAGTSLRIGTSNTERVRVASTGEVLIGTTSTTTGARLKIGSTDSIMLPVGTTAQRPGTPAGGMFRYNTTATPNDVIEYYDAESAAWVQVPTSASGGAPLSGISAALADNTIANGNWNQVWNWQLTGATEDAFTFGENTASTGGSGDQSVLKATTLASSTAVPLMVTNLGNGLSLRINDETGDADTTPFVVDASGNVGIGTATPGASLHVSRAGGTGATDPFMIHLQNATDQGSSYIKFFEGPTALNQAFIAGYYSSADGVTNEFRISGGFDTGPDPDPVARPYLRMDRNTGDTMFTNDLVVANTGSPSLTVASTDAGDIPVIQLFENYSGELTGVPGTSDGFQIAYDGNNNLFQIKSGFGGTFTDKLNIARDSGDVTLSGTGAIKINAGTTAQRPGTGVNGMIRYNADSNKFEGYQNGAWQDILTSGGGAGSLDSLSDAETDYATDFNLLIGTPADAWAIAVGGQYNLTLGQTAGDSITTGDRNVAMGYGALTTGATMTDNIAIGYNALTLNQNSGTNNVAIGSRTMDANTTGDQNVAIGTDALGTNSTVSGKTAIGYQALMSSAGGGPATAIGWMALALNDGAANTAVGYEALSSSVSGYENTALGHTALKYSTGAGNTAIGAYAMQGASSGNNNTAVGDYAMHNGSTTLTGSDNAALGAGALGVIVGGNSNVAVGKDAVSATTNASGQTGVGYNSLKLATGGTNTALGFQSGNSVTTGTGNLLLGYDVDTPTAGTSSFLNIGDTIFGDLANDRIRIGGSGAVGAFNDLELAGTLALKISAGTTAERPGTPVNGMIRYNSTTNLFEAYQNGAWTNMIGSGIWTDSGSGYIEYTNSLGGVKIGNVTGAAAPLFPTSGSAGASTFLALTDTPAAYTGAGYQVVKVNAGATALEFGGTDSLLLPSGTTAQRPGTPSNGMIRYNSTTGQFEGYQSGAWGAIAGSSIWSDSGSGYIEYSNALGGIKVGSVTGAAAPTVGYALDDLSDVSAASPALGDVVAWDGASSWTKASGLTSTIRLPSGTTAQRPGTPVNGMIRYNSTLNKFEAYENGAWTNVIGGGAASAAGADTQIQFNDGGTALGADSLFVWDKTNDRLGVGTAAPATRLHIQQDTGSDDGITIRRFDSTHSLNSAPMIFLDRARGNGAAPADPQDGDTVGAIRFRAYNSSGPAWTTSASIRGVMSGNSGGNAPIDLVFSTSYNDGAGWNSSVQEAMRLTKDRTVGIGTSTPGAKVDIHDGSSTGNSIRTILNLTHYDDDSAAASGIGAALTFNLETATAGTNREAARIAGVWDDATNNSKDGSLRFYTMGPNATSGTTTTTEAMRIVSGGISGAGATPITGVNVGAIAFGDGAFVNSNWSAAIGGGASATNQHAFAMGYGALAAGYKSLALGRSMHVTGDRSVGISAGEPSATRPEVQGDDALGIFMGDQNAVDFAANNTMGVFGGKMVIDPAVPATQLTARGVIDAGAATDAIVLPRGTDAQRPGTPAGGMFRYNTTATPKDVLEYYDSESAAWVQIPTSASGGAPLSGISAATGTNTIASGDNAQVWNWALTTATKDAFTFGETTAATGGSGDQSVLKATALASSTAVPLMVTNLGNSLSLRVNDATGDADTTPFVVDASGNVGIGTLTPSKPLSIVADDPDINIDFSATPTGAQADIFFNGQRSSVSYDRASESLALSGDRDGNSIGDLYLYGKTSGIIVKNNGNVGIGMTTPSVALDVTGDIEYSGTITDVSDIRLKTDIRPLNERGSMLDKIGQIDTYSFRMKDDPKKQTEFGVVAQEIEKVFPELVRTDDTPEHYKSVNYVGMIAPVIESAKELKAKNETMKAELDDLKEQVALLNKAAIGQTGKASMDGWVMLIIGLLLGGNLAFFMRGDILRWKRG